MIERSGGSSEKPTFASLVATLTKMPEVRPGEVAGYISIEFKQGNIPLATLDLLSESLREEAERSSERGAAPDKEREGRLREDLRGILFIKEGALGGFKLAAKTLQELKG
jgi:hypothetical protein